jgi:hypothetical protein
MADQSAFVWDESYTNNTDFTLAGPGALTTKQFMCLQRTAKDTVDIFSAPTTQNFAGILQTTPGLQGGNKHAAVARKLGKTKAVVDGSGTAIAAGDPLGPNASGVLVKKTTAGNLVVATSNDAASVANVIIEVELTGNDRYGFVAITG